MAIGMTSEQAVERAQPQARQGESPRRPGRPRRYGARENVTMSWPTAMRDALDALALDMGKTRTDLVIEAVREQYAQVRQAMEQRA